MMAKWPRIQDEVMHHAVHAVSVQRHLRARHLSVLNILATFCCR